MTIENATDAQIVAALEQLVRDGDDAGTFIILEGSRFSGYYVQFAPVRGEMLCEAVSNHHLWDRDKLGDEQEQVLRDLGWAEPGNAEGNWTRTLPPTTDAFAEIVGLTRRAFTEAYGLPEDAPLTLKDS